MLVVIFAFWVMFAGVLPHFIISFAEQINQTVFRVGLYFSKIPSPRTPITVIHVPDLEYERWLVDLPGSKRLLQLLNQLQGDPKQAATLIGLVLEYPIALIQPEVESILADVQQGRTTDQHLYQEVSSVLQRRANILEKLTSQNVILGVENHRPSRYRAINVRQGTLKEYPEFIVDWLWPTPFQPTISTVSPVLNYYPIITNEFSKQTQYLSVKQQNNYIPSFWAQYIMASKLQQLPPDTLAESANVMTWVRDRGFSFAGHQLNVSPTGALVPIYGQLSGIKISLRQISLSAALRRDDLSGWIIIGRDSSENLSRSAQILASLGDNAVLLEPVWWSPLFKGMLALCVIFLLVIVPLISNRRAVWGLFLLSLTFLTVQIIGQVVHGFWLPSGILLIFIVSSYLAMFVWLVKYRYQRQLLFRADACTSQLVEHILEDHQLDTTTLLEASALLRSCQTSAVVLMRLYDIGSHLEARGEFAHAFEVFNELRRRKWRYRDVTTKLKAIKSLLAVEQQQGDDSNDAAGEMSPPLLLTKAEEVIEFGLDQTQAIAGLAMSKTAFGRYEIERELGRGASGTVYLGFDPLISRQVAIKTLNYHQFSEKEIEEVKARFVREAEAAGSLSHPNIVPVFDVGEESGAAYIAMDFAKGSPLSDFVHQDNLLPIFEVYRITLAIAEALEYAHSNKIVHRDIKPGNVLYCSEPFQVKITDFGIARFVDNSQTRTGEILGSPLYMAPEQLLGKKVSYSADIFSLGVMFYQLLTGVLPFNGDSLAGLTYDIVHSKHKGARTLRRALPASATRITNVALQKKAGERYPSAAAMADALRKAIKRDFSSEAKSNGYF